MTDPHDQLPALACRRRRASAKTTRTRRSRRCFSRPSPSNRSPRSSRPDDGAIAEAAARDARRARQVRTGVLSGTVVATGLALYAGAGWAVGLVSAGFLGVLNLLIAGGRPDG